MNDFLVNILTYKRREIAERKVRHSAVALETLASRQSPPRGFARALERIGGGAVLIAEIKRASPSRGLIRQDFDPVQIARAYEAGGAACLSVLTDRPSFQGEEIYLIKAREAVSLPVLRKDFIIDPWQVAESRAIGADAILIVMDAISNRRARELVAEAQRFDMDVLAEAHDAADLDRALCLDTRLIGINNRSLKTFKTSLSVSKQLAVKVPGNKILVAESGIKTNAEIRELEFAGVDAFLVGEALMRQEDVEAATRTLRGG